ncbi:MAG: MFS transporter [Deltaproteobacteria bacterium]|nr:MFS transporter [Deltaproteobacteria bacterium]
MPQRFDADLQYYKFCLYGFLKNLRFFEPFLILFFLAKGLTYLQIGTLYALREIATNILELPTGVLADLLGRRSTMICSFIAYLISFVIFYVSEDYGIFILAMILFAFGEAFRTGTHKAMIFEYLSIKGWTGQKVYYYGHTRSWSQMGSAISSLIAAAIVFSSSNYNAVFIWATLPYLLDLLLLMTYPKELDGNMQKLEARELKQRLYRLFREFISSFSNLHLLRGIANLSVFNGYHKATKDYLQPVLTSFALALPVLLSFENLQRSAFVIGIVYFMIYVLTSIASRSSGRNAERFEHLSTPLNLTIISGLIMGVLAGLFYNLHITVISIVLFVGLFVVQNLRKPMGIAYVSELMHKDILATALSAESQISSLIAAVLAVILGFFADMIGVGSALIITSALLLIMSPFCMAQNR